MNKKGFTLVEILAVIVILAIITTIATVTFTSVKKKSLQRQYNAQITNIELQAEKYASNIFLSGNYAYITVNDLVVKGLIDSENGIVKSPYNTIINCYAVCLRKNTNTNSWSSEMLFESGDSNNDVCSGSYIGTDQNAFIYNTEKKSCIRSE